MVLQVAEREDLVTRLQSELHQSAAETETQLASLQKLETERINLTDELKTVKDQVFNESHLIAIRDICYI